MSEPIYTSPCGIVPPETIDGKPVVDTLRVAAIAPCRSTVGFDWGTDREHFVFDPHDPQSIYDSLLALFRGEDFARAATQRILSGMEPEAGWDVAVVDITDGITDEWPSAGDGECFGDDVWLGIADALSTRTFSELLGIPFDYTFPDPDRLDEEAIEALDDYIPEWRDYA